MKKSSVLKEVEKFAKGNKQTKIKFIELFISQNSQEIQQLQACLINKDWSEIKKIVHRMKATFILLAMKEAKTLTDTIGETAGVNVKATAQQVNKLSKICLEVISEFKNEKAKPV
jgi:HPt (histidine-containing phosphotransfer) domain-containing protein